MTVRAGEIRGDSHLQPRWGRAGSQARGDRSRPRPRACGARAHAKLSLCVRNRLEGRPEHRSALSEQYNNQNDQQNRTEASADIRAPIIKSAAAKQHQKQDQHEYYVQGTSPVEKTNMAPSRRERKTIPVQVRNTSLGARKGRQTANSGLHRRPGCHCKNRIDPAADPHAQKCHREKRTEAAIPLAEARTVAHQVSVPPGTRTPATMPPSGPAAGNVPAGCHATPRRSGWPACRSPPGARTNRAAGKTPGQETAGC